MLGLLTSRVVVVGGGGWVGGCLEERGKWGGCGGEGKAGLYPPSRFGRPKDTTAATEASSAVKVFFRTGKCWNVVTTRRRSASQRIWCRLERRQWFSKWCPAAVTSRASGIARVISCFRAGPLFHAFGTTAVLPCDCLFHPRSLLGWSLAERGPPIGPRTSDVTL